VINILNLFHFKS